jgi:hypothetical protein
MIISIKLIEKVINFNALKSTIVSPNVKSRDEEDHPIENILPGVYNSIFQKKYE